MANDLQVSLIEQRLFAKADKTTKRVIAQLLAEVRDAANNNGRYHKALLGGYPVGYLADAAVNTDPFRAMNVDELLVALEQSLFDAWRDKFRGEEVDAFIARVDGKSNK
jgi:hypothetical protein